MDTLLAFNVKIAKSILKYFITEASSNVTILDGISVGAEIDYCIVFWRAPLQNERCCTVRCLRFASKWPQSLGLDT